MTAALFGSLIVALYIGGIVLVVYLVVSALNRIGRGLEDIAQILRRMESKGSQ